MLTMVDCAVRHLCTVSKLISKNVDLNFPMILALTTNLSFLSKLYFECLIQAVFKRLLLCYLPVYKHLKTTS